MLSVLIEGVLTADPVARTSAKNTPFVTATMRIPTDGEALLGSVIAFNLDAGEALATLSKGDSVAIAGTANLSHWTGRNGEACTGLSVTANRVMTVYAAGKRRAAASKPAAEDPAD